jgi:hypothetical protein
MATTVRNIFAVLGVFAVAGTYAVPAAAQGAEAKEKPPMYTYVSNWIIPRARWADMDKAGAAEGKIMEKALASGSLIGYGADWNLVHQPETSTHDSWWSSMSMAGLLNALDEIYKTGSATSPVLSSATKHWDNIYVSRFYNWHSGVTHGAYTHSASYKLKPDAPDDAVKTVSKNFIVPMLDKLVADGTLVEYEVDTETIHTEEPGKFWIVYITANSEGVDKVNAALRDALKESPFAGPAFSSMVDFTQHRDGLARTNATYK